jgi:hypothetical protein
MKGRAVQTAAAAAVAAMAIPAAVVVAVTETQAVDRQAVGTGMRSQDRQKGLVLTIRHPPLMVCPQMVSAIRV